MRNQLYFAVVAATLIMPCPGFSQTPPPNDNFTNSITLTGNDVTFSGTLGGATIEGAWEPGTAYPYLFNTPSNSVWWNWTASTNTTLTIQVLSYNSGGSIPPSAETVVLLYHFTNQFNPQNSPYGLAFPAGGSAGLIYAYRPLSLS